MGAFRSRTEALGAVRGWLTTSRTRPAHGLQVVCASDGLATRRREALSAMTASICQPMVAQRLSLSHD